MGVVKVDGYQIPLEIEGVCVLYFGNEETLLPFSCWYIAYPDLLFLHTNASYGDYITTVVLCSGAVRSPSTLVVHSMARHPYL